MSRHRRERSETCVPDGHVCVCAWTCVHFSDGVYVDMAVCPAPVPGTQLVWARAFVEDCVRETPVYYRRHAWRRERWEPIDF